MPRNHLLQICLLILLFFQFSCSSKTADNPDSPLAENFPDILNIKNVPDNAADWSAYWFSDRGAWFGFALPPDSLPLYKGAFTGPFLITQQKWLGKSFIQFQLQQTNTGQPIEGYESGPDENIFYPGRLFQQSAIQGMVVELQLIYIDSYTALLKASLINQRSSPASVRASWTGDLFENDFSMEQSGNRLSFSFKQQQEKVFLTSSRPFTGKKSSGRYIMKLNDVLSVPPGEKQSAFMVFSLSPDSSLTDSIHRKTEAVLQNPELFFAENRNRWNRYLRTVHEAGTRWTKIPVYRKLAVKCLLTLITNWRASYKDLKHDGLFPSYAIWYFNGFWGWDSWKHSAALAGIEPALAKNQIRAMLDYQNKAGMIADCIYADQTENNWRNTKPPLAAWAVWKIFEHTGDATFLEEVAPGLIKFHQWWYEYRDHDNNGLCEYGSTDGTVEAARWESGMDDGLRFDYSQMVKNDTGAWSLNQESCDLNSYLYADKLYLAAILKEIGKNQTASRLQFEAEELKKKIRDQMFDPVDGFFYDIRLTDKSFVKVAGPEGWIPLWAGIATEEQAAAVCRKMTDTTKFATYLPFPTIPADHPQFMSGYWRGPVWLDQAYFGIRSLEKYGCQPEADRFIRQLFDRPEGLVRSNMPIRENYNPVTGEGMKVNHFSWSAAHLLMLILGE